MTSDLGHRAAGATTAELRTAAALRWQRPLLTAELAGYACVRAVADGDDLRWVQAAGWMLAGHAAGGDARDVATAVLGGVTGTGRPSDLVPAVPGPPPGAEVLARPEASRLRVELATVAQADGEFDTARALVSGLADDGPGEEPGLLRLDRLAVEVRCALAGQSGDDLDLLRREVEDCGAEFGGDTAAFADLVVGSVHRACGDHEQAVERALRGLAELGWTPDRPDARPLSAHLAAALLSQWITALLDGGRPTVQAVWAASAQHDAAEAGRQGVLLRLTLARADAGPADRTSRVLADVAAGAGAAGVPALVTACRTAQSELHEGAGRYREALEAMRSATEAEQLDRDRARRFRQAVAAVLPVAGAHPRSRRRRSAVRSAPGSSPLPGSGSAERASGDTRGAASASTTVRRAAHARPDDGGPSRGRDGATTAVPADRNGLTSAARGERNGTARVVQEKRNGKAATLSDERNGTAATVPGEGHGTAATAPEEYDGAGTAVSGDAVVSADAAVSADDARPRWPAPDPVTGPAAANVRDDRTSRERDRVRDARDRGDAPAPAIDPADPLGVSGMLTGSGMGNGTAPPAGRSSDAVGPGAAPEVFARAEWAGWDEPAETVTPDTRGSGAPLADALLAELRGGSAGIGRGRSPRVGGLGKPADVDAATKAGVRGDREAGGDHGRGGAALPGDAEVGGAGHDAGAGAATTADVSLFGGSELGGRGEPGTDDSGDTGRGVGRGVARHGAGPSAGVDRSIVVDVVDPDSSPVTGDAAAAVLEEIAMRSRRLVPPSGTARPDDAMVRIALPDADRVTALLWARSLSAHLAGRVHRGGLPAGAALRLRCIGPHGAEGDELVRDLTGPDEPALQAPLSTTAGGRAGSGPGGRFTVDGVVPGAGRSPGHGTGDPADAAGNDAAGAAGNDPACPAGNGTADGAEHAAAAHAEPVAGSAMATSLPSPWPEPEPEPEFAAGVEPGAGGEGRAGRRRAADGAVSPLFAAGIEVRPGSGGRRRSDGRSRSGTTAGHREPAGGDAASRDESATVPDDPATTAASGSGPTPSARGVDRPGTAAGANTASPAPGVTERDTPGADRRLADMVRAHLDLGERQGGQHTGREGRPVAWSSVSEGDGPADLPKRNGRRARAADRPSDADDTSGNRTGAAGGADVWTLRSARADARETPDSRPAETVSAGTGQAGASTTPATTTPATTTSATARSAATEPATARSAATESATARSATMESATTESATTNSTRSADRNSAGARTGASSRSAVSSGTAAAPGSVWASASAASPGPVGPGVGSRTERGSTTPSDDRTDTPDDPNAIPEGMGLADLLAGALAAYREI
ncbi:syndecan 1 [Pseudonocardia ammonioxydans]|uniref:Syndecan 1 n=1 Tax=Pseudonocardia ammonioxydans TaxID=260086 RepID=A0A1I5F6Q3_PSUAM|nr:hypothetical protein [Pseudonocardia ammonioxydans]SFO19319.1 syndecan 1 [Pseudonocardia ammonioxydans]